MCDDCVFLLMGSDRAGEFIDFGPKSKIFNDSDDERTMNYIEGRFG